MVNNKPDLEESIQIAIDAAAAANDAGSDVARIKESAESAINKLNGFVRTTRPLVLGAMLGGGLAALFAASVFVKAVTDLRVARVAHLQAFENLIEVTNGITEMQNNLSEQNAKLDAINSVVANLPEMNSLDRTMLRDVISEVLSRTDSTEAQPSGDPLIMSQMLSSLAELTEAEHIKTRTVILNGLSGGQLVTKPKNAATAARPVARPTPKPKKKRVTTRRTAPVSAPKSVPARNPFQFP